MAIDFANLKPRELPTKTITVNVLGVPQSLDIHPLTGQTRLAYWATDFIEDRLELVNRRTRLALTNGADLTEDEAEKLIGLDWDAALEVFVQVNIMTQEFDEAVAKEKAEAEKN